VAGIIGALHDNRKGVEGINPFARLVVRALALGNSETTDLEVRTSFGEAFIWDFDQMVRARPDVRVINISMAYNWYQTTSPLNMNTDTAVHRLAKEQGWAFRRMLEGLAHSGHTLPVVTLASGNDSRGPHGTQVARFASPMTNAALEPPYARNLIVVESVHLDLSQFPGQATRSAFSNPGGHVSAPGGRILSTVPATDGNYDTMSGTSMAAPLVAGLVGYLYTLDSSLPAPTLHTNPVLDLLRESAVAVGGGASDRVDAFGAALALDRLNGNDRVLRMLLDVDDGTEDGNRRTDPDADGADYTETDADGDGGVGDGRIDMRDFRRFRDAYLALSYAGLEGLVDLDGSATHLKKDLNLNGTTASEGDDETLYPRMDFNGDGNVADLDSTAYVGGVFQRRVTDLEMLEHLFDDPHYDRTDLKELTSSADIAIRPAKLLEVENVVDIHSSVRRADAEAAEEDPKFRRIHTGEASKGEGLWQVYTVASFGYGDLTALEYTALVVGMNAQGDTIFRDEKTYTATLGIDHFWDPGCRTHTGTLTLATQVEVEAAAGVCEIRGALHIDQLAGTSDPIVSLRPLSDLKRLVRGSTNMRLMIRSTTALRDLTGLERFTMEPGFLFIENNTALTSLAGLGTLAGTGVAAMLTINIHANPVLTDISAIANLLRLEGVSVHDLSILANTSLSSLAGLGAIQHANTVGISGPGITSLDELKLEIVDGGLGISDTNLPGFDISQFLSVSPPFVNIVRNLVLKDLHLRGDSLLNLGISGNGSLETVSIDYARGIPNIIVQDEPALTTLDLRVASGMAQRLYIQRTGLRSIGTSTITSVQPRPGQSGEGLQIWDNPQLNDIDAFLKVTSIDRFLIIRDNPQLCVPDWFHEVPVTQSRTIANNGSCP
jgi:hypothetical protein